MIALHDFPPPAQYDHPYLQPGSVIDLNGTVATDSTARTPAGPFHIGSVSGSSAFWNGNITRLVILGSKIAAPQ